MSYNGNRYTNELKEQIIKLYQAGKSVEKLNKEYGILTQKIYKWRRKLEPVQLHSQTTITMEEYKAIQKQMAELQLENEILKKATAIFA